MQFKGSVGKWGAMEGLSRRGKQTTAPPVKLHGSSRSKKKKNKAAWYGFMKDAAIDPGYVIGRKPFSDTQSSSSV